MATDYKNTLNLPRTGFPMKADLVAREPERLKKWQETGLYTKIQAARANAEKFVLHDGPPFANGDVHIGTALNKILKDIIIKYKTLRGFSAPYGLGLPRPAHRIQGFPGDAQAWRRRPVAECDCDALVASLKFRRRHHPQSLRSLRPQIH
jgi:hypothetical protein